MQDHSDMKAFFVNGCNTFIRKGLPATTFKEEFFKLELGRDVAPLRPTRVLAHFTMAGVKPIYICWNDDDATFQQTITDPERGEKVKAKYVQEFLELICDTYSAKTAGCRELLIPVLMDLLVYFYSYGNLVPRNNETGEGEFALEKCKFLEWTYKLSNPLLHALYSFRIFELRCKTIEEGWKKWTGLELPYKFVNDNHKLFQITVTQIYPVLVSLYSGDELRMFLAWTWAPYITKKEFNLGNPKETTIVAKIIDHRIAASNSVSRVFVESYKACVLPRDWDQPEDVEREIPVSVKRSGNGISIAIERKECVTHNIDSHILALEERAKRGQYMTISGVTKEDIKNSVKKEAGRNQLPKAKRTMLKQIPSLIHEPLVSLHQESDTLSPFLCLVSEMSTALAHDAVSVARVLHRSMFTDYARGSGSSSAMGLCQYIIYDMKTKKTPVDKLVEVLEENLMREGKLAYPEVGRHELMASKCLKSHIRAALRNIAALSLPSLDGATDGDEFLDDPEYWDRLPIEMCLYVLHVKIENLPNARAKIRCVVENCAAEYVPYLISNEESDKRTQLLDQLRQKQPLMVDAVEGVAEDTVEEEVIEKVEPVAKEVVKEEKPEPEKSEQAKTVPEKKRPVTAAAKSTGKGSAKGKSKNSTKKPGK